MKKPFTRIASLIMAVAMLLGNHLHTQAAGSIYYVSPTGSDTNPGTATAPFRTFAKANSLLTAGSTLYIYAGTYSETLKISKSGTSSARITVKPVSGAVIVDMKNAVTFGLNLAASYVTVSGLEIKNSGDICVNMVGTNLIVNSLIVHECMSHGINTNNSSQIQILNSRVYRTVLSNASRSVSSGWGSGIKVRVSDNVLIQGNIVYNNYGEGMGTRGTNVTIRANTVYDNFSVNIYTNSENALIERNFVYCKPNSGFERDGLPAAGIGLGEEYFDGWGARLKNARVINNIVAFCKHGVRYNGADDRLTGGGLKSATIAYNTLYGSTNSALSIVYESAQSGSLIANNIIWQAQDKLTSIDNPVGLTFKNNFWKVLPAVALRSSGDKTGDPRFATTPGYTAESYRPSSSSPAAASAVDISIPVDYFSKSRGPAFDMGSIQFGASVTSSSQPTATLAALTVQPTNVVPSPTLQATASPVPTTIQPTNTATITVPQATATAVSPTAQPTDTLPSTIPQETTVAASPTIDATTTSLPVTPTATSLPTIAFTATPTQRPPTATRQPTQTAPASTAGTTYDNKNAAFVYSAGWVEEVSKYASGGSFARTSTNGSSVTFKFTGQSFSLIYKGGPAYRKINVYLDNALVATIDEHFDVSTYKARWDYPGQFSLGAHTLKLVFVTTSSSTNGSVDAIIVR